MSINQDAYSDDKNALGVTYETAALIGKRLRQARETKRLSHSQVSARVKIRDRYIEAIEIGDWDVLPPGLNGRGLIRLYARELSVAIPEFEAFHHLQTVMVERQSESLMQAASKKSKYHPAAEESAEIIRSISRSDFQKGISLDQDFTEQDSIDDRQGQAVKVHNRTSPGNFATRSVHKSASTIVTPNIYDVLGIQVEDKAFSSTNNAISQQETKAKSTYQQNLPTAEPVKLEHIHSQAVEDSQTQATALNFKGTLQSVKNDVVNPPIELPFVAGKEVSQEQKIKKKSLDFNPVQILAILSFVLTFVFLSLFLYSKNTSQIKVTNLSAKQIESEVGESEALPNSVVESNIPPIQEAKKTTPLPAQTKTVATDDKTTAVSSIQRNKIPIEIERIAKLNITAKVNLVVEADGKEIFSGVHAVGVLDIPFKNKAEIMILDSSKVSLIYEGINHGILGHSGRKRKITLNAKPYTD